MSLSVYLYFDGKCGEAFEHYKDVFNVEEVCLQKYSDGPPDMFGDAPGDYVMHTTLKIGETMLMGADRVPCGDEPAVFGNGFAVSYKPNSKEEADSSFHRLADGGRVTMELTETFWGSYFGLCTDKWGVHWMFNFPFDRAEDWIIV